MRLSLTSMKEDPVFIRGLSSFACGQAGASSASNADDRKIDDRKMKALKIEVMGVRSAGLVNFAFHFSVRNLPV
ncbi:MAG: hypothetical protein ACKV2Q_19635 [Planctomycetaceae bacterium]